MTDDVEHIKLCDLGRLGRFSDVTMWKHIHQSTVWYTIQYAGIERDFFTPESALKWFEVERQNREIAKRREYGRRKYARNHNLGFY